MAGIAEHAQQWLKNYHGKDVMDLPPQTISMSVLLEYLSTFGKITLERAAQEAEKVSKMGLSGHDAEKGWWDVRTEIAAAIRRLKGE